ncbi:hypothetical protein F4818DRAFT_444405 [Hypoxylon cercidicola]|nr:hypothetical protein F4818DRAFT_444405 [Hypoxylon cercidicola]
MTKIVNSHAATLKEARKIIEEQRKQIEVLSRENRLLRARATPTASITRESSPSWSDHETCRRATKYDSPTRAFINRVAETCKTKRQTEKIKRTEVNVDGASYHYTNGRLIQISHPHIVPRYMQETRSSLAKSEARGWGPTFRVSCKSDYSFIEDSVDSGEERDMPPPEETSDDEDTSPGPVLYTMNDLKKLVGEPVRDLFPKFGVQISSKDGFDVLRAAHRIAQEAFYDAARKFWPSIWDSIQEGPHLVRLGRTEIGQYMGETGTHFDLSLCGSQHSTVYYTLLDLVDLRNTLCHPGTPLQSVCGVDSHLLAVQMFTLALRDEQRSMKIRSMRDELRRLAVESFDRINCFSSLAVLPFANEANPHWEPYQKSMFRTVLLIDVESDWRGFDTELQDRYRGLLQVAQAWALDNNPWLLQRSW